MSSACSASAAISRGSPARAPPPCCDKGGGQGVKRGVTSGISVKAATSRGGPLNRLCGAVALVP
eukprot:917211-Prorocentrum_minimum.AAC.1